MNTTKPKPKKASAKPLSVEPTTGQAANKKIPNKSPTAESAKTAGTEGIVKAVESEVATSNKKGKNAKAKVIRDSFPFPEQDYQELSGLKKTCLAAGIHVKKGEILRAGLHLLTKLDLTELKQVLGQVEKVQTGRPNPSKS